MEKKSSILIKQTLIQVFAIEREESHGQHARLLESNALASLLVLLLSKYQVSGEEGSKMEGAEAGS